MHEGRLREGGPPGPKAIPLAEGAESPAVGDTLGGYRIVGKLGAGGMGQVFRARDTELERDVALKLLHPSLTRQLHAMSRFRREARLLAAVNHPNIATIFGTMEDGGIRFLVMELVDGETLAQKLLPGRLPVPFALDIGRQIAAALDAAHRKGVIHRDLKPANVMVSPEGWVKVLDFGLAKALANETVGGTVSEETRVQGVLGTAPYMSPEQVRELDADWRTDVWAFGCVFFEMVTGMRAFVGQTRIDLLRAILDVDPPWRELPAELPAAVADLLRRCLAKEAGRRPSMGDIRAGLEEALAGLPAAPPGTPAPPSRPRTPGPAEVAPEALGLEAATLGYLDSLGEYTVVEKIAAGGQGEVYRAWDRGRKRDTALKVLRPELTGDAEARRRLQEEARVLTWLRHPNIANLYDFGTSGGLDFLVTEYITGTTLASRLVDGPLPEAAVVRLGAQIAAALAEAHEHGILHRDLKTSNVMVTPDGQAKVIDFGLSSVPSQPTGSAANSGRALEGPLAYRAPEVVAGDEPDAKSDLYSLGVVLYAMATGEKPFAGASAEELADAVLNQPPAPPRQLRPALGTALERLILQCLEKDPELRPASARELAAGLAALLPADPLPSLRETAVGEPGPAGPAVAARRPRRAALWIAAAGLALCAIAAAFVWRWSARNSPLAAVDSVVVMPSRLLGTGQPPYLPDAIAQTLAGDLAKVAGVTAKMPPSSFEVARLGGDLARVASAYGAEAMVLSTAGVEEGRLSLALQLIEAGSRDLLWSRQYQGAPGSHLELARQAAADLRRALRPGTPAVPAPPRPLDPQAERLVQQGLYYSNLYRNRGQVDDQKRALAAFEKALAGNPTRADLAGEVAMLHALSLDFGTSILEVQPEIRRWAGRALALDPRCSKAWAALAYLEGGRQKEGYRRQLEYLLKAASYDPSDAYAANRLSGPLAKLSYRLALESSRHASETDPLVLTSQIFEAICLMPLGRHDEALARLDQTLALEPGMPFGLLIKGLVESLSGRHREALALVRDKLEPFAAEGKLHPGWVALARDLSTFALASESGDKATADAAAGRLLAAARGEAPFPRWEMTTTEVAGHLARWGRKEEALELLLFRSHKDLVQPYDYVLLSPSLAPLRDDPRFRDDPRLQEIVTQARAQFEEILAILEEARAKGELPGYLEPPLADLLKSIREARTAPPRA